MAAPGPALHRRCRRLQYNADPRHAIEVAAYCIFFGFAGWKRVLYPCTALALLVFHGARYRHASPNDLVVLMSMIIALFTGAMAWILLRPGVGHSLLRRVIGVNDFLFFLAMGCARLQRHRPGPHDHVRPGAVQSVTYLAGYLLMIVNGFGFLLLCKEKDDQKLALLATIDSLTGLVNRRAFFERTDSGACWRRAYAARSR